jgi:hypothetical protein
MIAFPRRELGRNDRYVRRGRLSLSEDAPPRKLAMVAEESLRLCSLPGEDQGRVYYIRRLHVRELPEDGDRRAWLNAFQAALLQSASEAVHGSDPRAGATDAVFFRSQQEACETLLLLIASRAMPLAWYWRHVSGTDRVSTAAIELVAAVEKLIATPPAWTAVAAAMFYVARRRDVLTLLKSMPEEAVVRWLRELGAADPAYAAPLRFSGLAVETLARALDVFAPESPVVLWLATLAVISTKPASAENGSAVRIARSSLRAMLAERTPITEATASPASAPKPVRRAALEMAEASHAGAERSVEIPGPPAWIENAREIGPPCKTDTAGSPRIESLIDSGRLSEAHETRAESYFGEISDGAGLFFLLNALRHLQFDKQNHTLLFLARLLRFVGDYAGIGAGDPILRWSDTVEQQSEPEPIDERSLRIWLIRIRRWCWKNGRICVREIVSRRGYVTLTRTDLDVTLSIDSADIRIRRIGLDLDPGWLPWFGRVVRFHYRYRGEICG